MKDRIKQYIDHKGISAGELATTLDVQRSNISHILNGRNKPGAAFIEKLLLVFPDLNARWLLTGKGNMVEGSENKEPVVSNTLPFTPAVEKEESIEIKKITEPKPLEDINQKRVDNVSKMILLYEDGTFATFKNRDNK